VEARRGRQEAKERCIDWLRPNSLVRLFEKPRYEEQNTFTKFDVEDSMGVLEVKHWFDYGNDIFMAERCAAL
jgi:hypothetical protein